ncbi:BTB/POZ domain-containing protein At3g56230 isoform X2 [Prosopis cineraria]|uniref:BTB/POZ domain-containing protein At3g56230 isoform X2 n=1 Tax=Prosopis cineraria TaxID=364024 RepID=UPI00240F9A3E|nr:BTB/POZ domain-containing protein At3g56230 isoform X2 [Prosopis cineraria]
MLLLLHPPIIRSLSTFKRWYAQQLDQMNEHKHQAAFLESFVDAFRAQIHTDITVTPGNHGSPIPSHKAVLATRSEVFKNMLDSDECKAAPTNNITIPELNCEELESLLEFLYRGSLGPEKLEQHVFALSLAADKYGIAYLQKQCEQYMLNSLSISNALDVLEIADTCSNQKLKDTTMKFLVENIQEIVLSLQYEAFVHRSPHLTVQLSRESLKVANNIK